MFIPQLVLLASLSLFVRSFPVNSQQDALPDNDNPQTIFDAMVDDDGPAPLSVTDVSGVPSIQDILVIPSLSPTTIWFGPERSPVPTQTSTDSGSVSFAPSPGPIVAAYYPDWTASRLLPEMVDFDRLDWVDFAFAVPDPTTYTPKFLDEGSGDLLNRLVSAAHAKDKFVKLSIGGWTGSAHFSNAVNDENRVKFAQDIVALYHQYNLDGIDIDWEYPGQAGAVGNIYTMSDSANLLRFLQYLRLLLPKSARITAATQVWPFLDANGVHMKDISSFAQVLDWVLLMNYDVWNSSPNPGPNAPLSNACNNSTQPEANAHAAILSWTTAGFPADQILLGLPAYGYVSRSTAESLRSRRRSLTNPFIPSNPVYQPPAIRFRKNIRSRDVAAADLTGYGGVVTVTSEAGSADSGQVQFNALISQGALVRNAPGASPAFVGTGGFQREWDACSSTPFLRSLDSQQIITYDDPESLGLKAAFVRESGILGVNMWDAHGDTREWVLVDSIRKGLGLT